MAHRLAGESELMDDPGSSQKLLYRTLDQFKTINITLSRARPLLKATLLPHMRAAKKPVNLLDLGSGGADIACWIHAYARKRKIPLTIYCLDNDPRVVDYARRRYGGIDGLHIEGGDALSLGENGRRYDYIFANHFLHHFPDNRIPELLAKIDRCAQRGYLLTDLRRSRLAFLGFTLAAGAFFHGSFAFYDGRISIRKGFTPGEFTGHVAAAGIPGVTVASAVPGRVYAYRLSPDD